MTVDKARFDKPLVEILDEAFGLFSERVCLQFEEQSYTYGEVQLLSTKVAQALAGAGFKKGMHAAIYSLNSAEAFIATLGIIRAGGVWIPVNPRNSEDDNVKVLGNLGCDVLIYQQAFTSALEKVETAGNKLVLSACFEGIEGQPSFMEWAEQAPKAELDVSWKETDTITIPMTGGTTGLPKGVMLSDRNFRALSYSSTVFMDREADHIPVCLCAAPMTHVGGRIALTSMAAGARFVIKDKVDLQDVLQTIQVEGISDLFLPPTAIYGLLAQPNVREFDYSSLRNMATGSAPMSVSQLKLAIEVFGPVMSSGFGQTECPMKITQMRPTDYISNGVLASDERLRSVGRATEISEVAILDDDANPLPVGERGEIGVKGGNVSEGYFNAPEQTAKIRKNGWHLTGDIGYMDDEGFVYIVDRKKDMIITGGFNVYSAEVELGLGAMDGVAGVAVIGVPSEKWGEEVKAIIQPAPGASLNAETIMQQAKELMGSVKAPKSVEFVDDFPKTPLGKIDKKVIRDTYWKGLDRAV
ncbi:long-chain fatty acid--CoA ligase [Maricurvus nonylphenolicus]|uniref:class I adenylate-forming enzyme family protein n=1 Tax=Maricurvus nonylphenolicus TaxID=1008307 RepID=UPI0036F42596